MNKFKKVILTWVIIYLLITTLFYVLSAWLDNMPVYIRTFVLSGIMVFGMQYLILPGLQQLRKKTNE